MRGHAGQRSGRPRKWCGTGAGSPPIRTIIFHGDADNIVHPSNGASMVQPESSGSVERAKVRHDAMRAHTRTVTRDKAGAVVVEHWLIHGGGHAWSGGSADGTYTDPQGPDASREMLRFFFEEPPT
jgi:poly(3-hydroxybutyrate) depolymerase